MDERSSITSAHKGVEGGQGLDLEMDVDHDWSPDTRLQGRAASLVVDINGGSRMGHLGQMPPPPPPLHLVEEPAMLLIKTASKFCQANRDQFKNYENMHILLAFITNSPEAKANRSQTNCKIVT